MARVRIESFKTWKGKKKYMVFRGFTILGGGFRTKKAAQKYKKYAIKHKIK